MLSNRHNPTLIQKYIYNASVLIHTHYELEKITRNNKINNIRFCNEIQPSGFK